MMCSVYTIYIPYNTLLIACMYTSMVHATTYDAYVYERNPYITFIYTYHYTPHTYVYLCIHLYSLYNCIFLPYIYLYSTMTGFRVCLTGTVLEQQATPGTVIVLLIYIHSLHINTICYVYIASCCAYTVCYRIYYIRMLLNIIHIIFTRYTLYTLYYTHIYTYI